MLSLPHNQVELHAYSDGWPRRFAEEKARIEAGIGDHLLDIQHVGSTAVPGLPAKPIIDIGVAVANIDGARSTIAPLESIGYLYRGENGIPRRHFFRKGDPTFIHLHMNEFTSICCHT